MKHRLKVASGVVEGAVFVQEIRLMQISEHPARLPSCILPGHDVALLPRRVIDQRCQMGLQGGMCFADPGGIDP